MAHVCWVCPRRPPGWDLLALTSEVRARESGQAGSESPSRGTWGLCPLPSGDWEVASSGRIQGRRPGEPQGHWAWPSSPRASVPHILVTPEPAGPRGDAACLDLLVAQGPTQGRSWAARKAASPPPPAQFLCGHAITSLGLLGAAHVESNHARPPSTATVHGHRARPLSGADLALALSGPRLPCPHRGFPSPSQRPWLRQRHVGVQGPPGLGGGGRRLLAALQK